jgi:hypothetical protein
MCATVGDVSARVYRTRYGKYGTGNFVPDLLAALFGGFPLAARQLLRGRDSLPCPAPVAFLRNWPPEMFLRSFPAFGLGL